MLNAHILPLLIVTSFGTAGGYYATQPEPVIVAQVDSLEEVAKEVFWGGEPSRFAWRIRQELDRTPESLAYVVERFKTPGAPPDLVTHLGWVILHAGADDPRVRSAFEQVARDSHPAIRLSILRALNYYPYATPDTAFVYPGWVQRVLANLLLDADQEIRDTALQVMLQHARSLRYAAVREAVRRLLISSDLELQGNAAYLLTTFRHSTPEIVRRMEALARTDSEHSVYANHFLWFVARDPVPAASRIRQRYRTVSDAIDSIPPNSDGFIAFEAPEPVLPAITRWITDHVHEFGHGELVKQLAAVDTLLASEELASFEREEYRHLRDLRGRLVDRLAVLRPPPPLWPFLVVGYLLGMFSLCHALLRLRPIWLFRINESLPAGLNVTLPTWLGGFTLPFASVTLFPLYRYHHRVLDAWVTERLPRARERFARRPSVAARRTHVPLAAMLDGQVVASVHPAVLRPVFSRQKFCLLITGEGGVGKSSLAFQIARWGFAERPDERPCGHATLPIVIEHEIAQSSAPNLLLSTVCAQLQDLIEEQRPIRAELVEILLRRQRILVIVDHLSEMSDRMRDLVRPDQPTFPANALIVTSRRNESLGVDAAELRPLRIRGNRLSSFIEQVLQLWRKRDLFTDREFFQVCEELSDLVGERDVTPLLAIQYAKLRVTAIESPGQVDIPRTIPQLMLEYLNELSRGIAPDERRPDTAVHGDAKCAAWAVVAKSLRPTTAPRDAILRDLGEGGEAEARLQYLEDHLQILQTVSPARDEIRYTLDPIAEYLAAMYFIESNAADMQAWSALFERIMASIVETREFALALLGCAKEDRYVRLIPQNARCELKTLDMEVRRSYEGVLTADISDGDGWGMTTGDRSVQAR